MFCSISRNTLPLGKGHNGNKYNEQVDELAYGAYCDICDLHNITKNPRH